MRGVVGEVAGVVLVWIAALVVARPLFEPFFFQSTDGLLHLYRALEFAGVWRDGVLWPRIAPGLAHGAGYPVFDFYSPGFYALTAALHLGGLGIAGAVKAVVWLGLALPGLAAYAYARPVAGRIGAGLVGAVYLAVPYHLFDVYFRGDFPQALAYGLIPLVFLGVRATFDRPGVLAAIGLAGAGAAVVLTHNLTAYLIAPFAALYAIVLAGAAVRERGWRGAVRPVRTIAGAGGLAALLTAAHWAPILADRGAVQFDRLTRFHFADAFTRLDRIVAPGWLPEYGVTVGGRGADGFRLTLLEAAGLVLGAIALGLLIRRRDRFARELIAQLAVAALAIFLLSDRAAALWREVPLLDHAQFPWRLLALIGLPVGLGLAATTRMLPGAVRPGAAIGLAAAFVIGAATIDPVRQIVTAADLDPVAVAHLELGYGPDGGVATGEFLPRDQERPPWVSAWSLDRAAGPPADSRPVERVTTSADRRTYRVTGWPGGALTLDTAAFPGWTAAIDGAPAAIAPAPGSGLIQIAIPPGDHAVDLHYRGTRVQRWSEGVSAGALAFVVVVLGWWLVRARREARAALRRIAPRAAIAALALGLPLLLVAGRLTVYAADEWRPLDVSFSGYRLTGYRVSAASLAPGEEVVADLGWAVEAPRPDVRIFARLVNRSTHGWAVATAPIDAAAGATGTSRLVLPVPPGTPPGSYHVQIGFRTPAGPLEPTATRIVHGLPQWDIRFGPVAVRRAPAAGVEQLDGINLDDRLRLTGWWIGVRPGDWRELPLDWPAPAGADRPPIAASPAEPIVAEAGWQIHADWHWQAARTDPGDLVFSFRLVDDDGFVWASTDDRPAGGLYPTPFWRAGERVHDQQAIYVRPDVPPGDYRLELIAVENGRPVPLRDAAGAPAGAAIRAGQARIVPARAWPSPADFAADRIDRALGGGLTLVNLRLSQAEARPGDRIAIESRWHAARPIAADLAVRWELVDPAGAVRAAVSGPPTGRAGYPTTAWAAGTVVRGRQTIALDPALPGGDYTLRAILEDPATGSVLGRETVGRLRLIAPDRVFAATFAQTIGVEFGGTLELAGLDLPGGVAPAGDPLPGAGSASGASKGGELAGDLPVVRTRAGEPLPVRIVWRGVRPSDVPLTVFVQAIDGAGHLVAQHDAPPAGGTRPTTGILPGEYVTDDHAVPLPLGLAPGRYTLIAGVYDPVTGRRRAAADGSTFVRLATVEVAP